MTRQAQYNYQCDDCERVDLICPDCGKSVKQGTPFSKWLRQLGKEQREFSSVYLDIHNLDFICFWYRQGWFITIEEKMFGGRPKTNQKDTHGVIVQMLQLSSGKKIKTQRGNRAIEYRGHYYVSFANTTPDNSEWVMINDKKHIAVKDAILRLLRHGKMP